MWREGGGELEERMRSRKMERSGTGVNKYVSGEVAGRWWERQEGSSADRELEMGKTQGRGEMEREVGEWEREAGRGVWHAGKEETGGEPGTLRRCRRLLLL